MALHLAFVREILCKSYDNVGSGRLELIKTGSRASITNMLCIETWNGVLILVPSVSISTISICLDRACFWIFLHTSAASKVMFSITPGYIVACREALERSTSGRKSLSKLVLSSAFCKQYSVCARLVYSRHSVISIDFHLWRVMQIAYWRDLVSSRLRLLTLCGSWILSSTLSYSTNSRKNVSIANFLALRCCSWSSLTSI